MSVFWIITAFYTKRNKTKTDGWTLRLVAIVVVILFIYLQKNVDFLGSRLWEQSYVIKIIADLVTFIGLLMMVWARKYLGNNWSGNIVLKENHELITSGPYAFVRHPIYSGLIMMVLGVALYVNTYATAIFVVVFFLGAYYKSQKEEKLLINYFPKEYLEYKKQTKALIPFIFWEFSPTP